MSSDVREKCRSFVAKHSSGHDGSHDISHIDRVVRNACRIYELACDQTRNDVNQEILIAIASLHDSFDHKYLTNEEALNRAKEEVRGFLQTDLSYSQETANMIIHVIDNMGYTAEVSGSLGGSKISDADLNYLHIVQDADRLDAIGAMGIARCLAFSGAFGRPIISETGEDERDQRARFREGSLKPVARKGGSAIAHFYDKLVFLKDMLKTPAGRSIGEERHKFILGFLDQFFDEVGA